MGPGEKKQAVMRYNSLGLSLFVAFSVAGITKHQYYYRKRLGKPGRKRSTMTLCRSGDQEVYVENTAVVEQIKQLKITVGRSSHYKTKTENGYY